MKTSATAAGALLAALALLAAPCIAAADDLVAAGESIYRSARRLDGSAVTSIVQGDVPLPPGSGACASCHRRSGIGVSEGGTPRSLNLTAPALFAEHRAPPMRPAYDERLLGTVLMSGVAPDGRVLNDLMPRYRATDADVRALTAYLRTLGAAPPPGVTTTDIEIATIVSTDTAPHVRAAIEGVLTRFVALKNGGTRRESERAAAARRHAFGKNHQRAYRNWHFTAWELSGPASSWRAQLEHRYKEATPFAIVSGSTGHDWSIVHDFCEEKKLPCLLPIADAPPVDTTAFYSLYYSTGVTLQAQVTARAILDTLAPEDEASVLLIYTDDERGRTARDAFVAHAGSLRIVEQMVSPGVQPSSRDWQRLLERTRTRALVAWLGNRELGGLLGAADMRYLPEAIYTAHAFGELERAAILPDVRQRIRHVYPYSLASDERSQFVREDAWLRAQRLAGLHPISAAEALFAAHVFGEALSDMETNFSREYLLETVEHALDQTQMTSLFPNTTLGAEQRFISRGAYLTRLGEPDRVVPWVDTRWVQP